MGDGVLDTADYESGNATDIRYFLKEFGWNPKDNSAVLEAKLQAELGELESENIHQIIETAQRTKTISDLIEKAIEELGRMDLRLMEYSNQLDMLKGEVGYIQKRHTTLHTHASNQKSLVGVIESALAPLAVPERDIHALKNESLETAQGVAKIEEAAFHIQVAMDHTVSKGLDSLAAVSGKKKELSAIAESFGARLRDFLSQRLLYQIEYTYQDAARYSTRGNIRLVHHESLEDFMARYRNLLMWLHKTCPLQANEIANCYATNVQKLYSKEISDLIETLRLHAKRYQPGDPMTFLFSHYVKEEGKISGNSLAAPFAFQARPPPGYTYLAYKRMDAMAMQGKLGSGTPETLVQLKTASGDDVLPPETAIGVMLHMCTIVITREQNFLREAIIAQPISGKKVSAWRDRLGELPPKLDLSDEQAAECMEKLNEKLATVLPGLEDQVKSFMSSCSRMDPTTVVAALAHIERTRSQISGTSLFWWEGILTAANQFMTERFQRLVQEQAKAIEDFKTLGMRRKGLASQFVRVYPNFVGRVERYMLEAGIGGNMASDTRDMVHQCNNRYIKILFETLEALGKEANSYDKGSEDDEKKKMQTHLAMIECMHNLYSGLKSLKTASLNAFTKQAKSLYVHHLKAYVRTLCKRHFGKLIDFFDGVDELVRRSSAEEVNYHLNFNRTSARKIVGMFPAKEMRKDIESMHRRVEKSFAKGSDLFQVVWKAVQDEMFHQQGRMVKLSSMCYGEEGVSMEFTEQDLQKYFKDMR